MKDQVGHEASAIARRFQSPWCKYSAIKRAVEAAMRRVLQAEQKNGKR